GMSSSTSVGFISFLLKKYVAVQQAERNQRGQDHAQAIDHHDPLLSLLREMAIHRHLVVLHDLPLLQLLLYSQDLVQDAPCIEESVDIIECMGRHPLHEPEKLGIGLGQNVKPVLFNGLEGGL